MSAKRKHGGGTEAELAPAARNDVTRAADAPLPRLSFRSALGRAELGRRGRPSSVARHRSTNHETRSGGPKIIFLISGEGLARRGEAEQSSSHVFPNSTLWETTRYRPRRKETHCNSHGEVTRQASIPSASERSLYARKDIERARKPGRKPSTADMAAKPIIQGQEFPTITPTAIKEMENISVEVDKARVRTVRGFLSSGVALLQGALQARRIAQRGCRSAACGAERMGRFHRVVDVCLEQ